MEIHGGRWLLASGYWQVEIHPRDKEKTVFCTSEGLYEFNVMPVGLCRGVRSYLPLVRQVVC